MSALCPFRCTKFHMMEILRHIYVNYCVVGGSSSTVAIYQATDQQVQPSRLLGGMFMDKKKKVNYVCAFSVRYQY